MKRFKVNSPRLQCFVLIMSALVAIGFLNAAPPAQSGAPKAKVTPEQKKSDGKVVNKNRKPPSASSQVGITRNEAKAKVAVLEQRLDQLEKDLQSAKREKPLEEKETPPSSDHSPVGTWSDSAPIPKAILVAAPEADGTRPALAPNAAAESPQVTARGLAIEPQGPTSSGDEVPRVIAHAPHAVPFSQPSPTSPVAEKANMPGYVISPFPPRHLIDATGMNAGAVVKDPRTGAIFRLPKDLVEVQVISEPR